MQGKPGSVLLLLLLLVSTLAVAFKIQPATADVDWWPMFHHDLTHTGYSTSIVPNTNQTLWNYTTGSWVDSSPAVAGGVVYVGSDDHNVYALNATTGARIWNYTTGSYVDSSPAVAGGVVYVGSGDSKVYALNATTGARIWNYTTSNLVFSSPAVAGGVVYVGSQDGKVYAFGVGVHDVAVTNVASSKTVVCQGFNCCDIDVTVANQGGYTETFNVTAYANYTATGNTTCIVTFMNVTLAIGTSTNLTFDWNTTGFAKGNYTLSAYAEPVQGETQTADNVLTDGIVKVTIVGDVNGDGKVNLIDVFSVALAYGSYPGDPKWNPNYDINNDGKINLTDYFTTALNYGKTDS